MRGEELQAVGAPIGLPGQDDSLEYHQMVDKNMGEFLDGLPCSAGIYFVGMWGLLLKLCGERR